MKNLKQELKKKTKEWLIDRLVELTIADEANADRIMLSLVGDKQDAGECTAKFKRQLDKAAEQIVTGFDSVADALAVMMPKNLEAIIEISEYALVKLDEVFELQDECELEYLVDAFRHLHLEACGRVKPEPRLLGKRLADLGRQTEWGFFDGPPDGYCEILGQEGLAVFASNR